MKRLLLAVALLPLAAAAGPYDQPYTIITSERTPTPDPLLKPVFVNRVDGENSINGQVVIAPGPHMIIVDLPPRQGFSLATQETLDLDTSPCMRYFIAAKLENPVGQRWKPVVRRSELIGECQTKFKSDTPAK
jgi:hypothetical protein